MLLEACMEQLDFKPPTVKPKDWDMIINPLMKNHEPIDPPEGVTTQDQLQNHLEEYCINRQVSTDKNDLKKVVCGLAKAIITLCLTGSTISF